MSLGYQLGSQGTLRLCFVRKQTNEGAKDIGGQCFQYQACFSVQWGAGREVSLSFLAADDFKTYC